MLAAAPVLARSLEDVSTTAVDLRRRHSREGGATSPVVEDQQFCVHYRALATNNVGRLAFRSGVSLCNRVAHAPTRISVTASMIIL